MGERVERREGEAQRDKGTQARRDRGDLREVPGGIYGNPDLGDTRGAFVEPFTVDIIG
jgi:hypothetical protein